MTRMKVACSATLCLSALVGCRTDPAYVPEVLPRTVNSDVPSISQQVRFVAVFHPLSTDGDIANGYEQLEQAVFQVTRQRPWVRVLDRHQLATVTGEQRLQLSARFSDAGAVHVGRMLGADSIVVFHIDGPSWRDRMLARIHGTLPPVVVSSKVVQVETGEILYHDMVIRRPVPDSHGADAYSMDFELQPLLRSSLEQSLSEAIGHLTEAFR